MVKPLFLETYHIVLIYCFIYWAQNLVLGSKEMLSPLYFLIVQARDTIRLIFLDKTKECRMIDRNQNFINATLAIKIIIFVDNKIPEVQKLAFTKIKVQLLNLC